MGTNRRPTGRCGGQPTDELTLCTRQPTMLTTRCAVSEDVEIARRIHHAAYRGVVEAHFGAWNEARQDELFRAKWEPGAVRISERNGTPIGCMAVVEHPDHLFLSEIQ